MTQAELGRCVGLRTASICDIEKGRQKPSAENAMKLASTFGVTVEQMLAYVEVPVS